MFDIILNINLDFEKD